MSDDDEKIPLTIEERVQKRINQRYKYYRELLSFVGVNVLLWGIWFLTNRNGSGIPWPAFVTFFWGIGVVSDGMKVLGEPRLDEMREREYRRELARERERLYGEEKPKRGEMAIGDDGELIYEDEQQPSKRKSAEM
jgi:hypothetical protein